MIILDLDFGVVCVKISACAYNSKGYYSPKKWGETFSDAMEKINFLCRIFTYDNLLVVFCDAYYGIVHYVLTAGYLF